MIEFTARQADALATYVQLEKNDFPIEKHLYSQIIRAAIWGRHGTTMHFMNEKDAIESEKVLLEKGYSVMREAEMCDATGCVVDYTLYVSWFRANNSYSV